MKKVLMGLFTLVLTFGCLRGFSQENASLLEEMKKNAIEAQLPGFNYISSISEITKDEVNFDELLKDSEEKMPEFETEKAIIVKFILKDKSELYSITIQNSEKSNSFKNYTIHNGILNSLDLNYISDDTGFHLSIDNDVTVQSRGYGPKKGWWGCMQNFLGDKHAGTFVNLMGVAAGVGCIPCAWMAGFVTGMMAIACIHG